MKTTSSELFVIYHFSNTEINDVYANKDEAELECVKVNESISKLPFYIKKIQYKVISLYDAIDNIKDFIRRND